MTIFARDPDTGKAKWAYQKTPHDAWDYDGINENVLVDLNMNGQMRKVLVNFDRNGFSYTLDRATGELLMAEPFVNVNWAKGIDLKTGMPIENPEKRTSSTNEHQGHLSLRHGRKEPAACRVLPENKSLLRSHQQSLHGLRRSRSQVPGGPAVCWRDCGEPSGSGWQPRRVHCLGSDDRERKCGASRKIWQHWGGALATGRRRGLLRHHGGMAESGECQNRRGPVEVQDSVGNHRQSDDVYGTGWESSMSPCSPASEDGQASELPRISARKIRRQRWERSALLETWANFSNQGGVLTVFSLP